MRPPLPTLGPQPKKSPVGPVMVVSLLLGLSAGGVWWWKQRLSSETPPAPAEQHATAPVAQAPGDAGSTAAAPPTTAPAATAPVDPLTVAGLSRASIRVDGPLETAVTAAAGPEVG